MCKFPVNKNSGRSFMEKVLEICAVLLSSQMKLSVRLLNKLDQVTTILLPQMFWQYKKKKTIFKRL